jgi:glycerate 2-kinase
MKIIIAPASFKGSMSAIEAARVMRKACLDVFPDSGVAFFPVADGGEGTIDILKTISGGWFITEEIHDPLFRKINGRWLKKSDKAYIEMAQAAGLALIAEKERNPLRTTTFGVGELIKNAVSSGCKEIFIGVGGSATNDGGIGALTAFGVRFIGNDGKKIYPGCGEDLLEIRDIDVSGLMYKLQLCSVTVLSDVQNPLYGREGAAYIYGPQKGAGLKDVKLLDRGLRNYSKVIKKVLGKDISDLPGAGAAGGIAGGFVAFLSAKIVSGIDTVLNIGGLEKEIKSADLVITGEGRIDAQTTYGKSPAVLAHLCRKYRVPLLILAGSIEGKVYGNRVFKDAVITDIVPGVVSLEDAVKNAKKYLYDTTRQMLKFYKISHSMPGMEWGKDR